MFTSQGSGSPRAAAGASSWGGGGPGAGGALLQRLLLLLAVGRLVRPLGLRVRHHCKRALKKFMVRLALSRVAHVQRKRLRLDEDPLIN
jgi:hypothetical protein